MALKLAAQLDEGFVLFFEAKSITYSKPAIAPCSVRNSFSCEARHITAIDDERFGRRMFDVDNTLTWARDGDQIGYDGRDV